MDEEIRQLAIVALKNNFYNDFSALVNLYIDVAKGLAQDEDDFEMQLGDMTSVYGRDDDANMTDIYVNIYVLYGSKNHSIGYETLAEALNDKKATEIFLDGKRIFIRKDNEWYSSYEYDENVALKCT